ncbi:MAG: ABC transporter ATP-binding protein [Pirellulaceae bacterium]|nr:ABC transporter ATP-binding protein [Pirellulaceae bacterium]
MIAQSERAVVEVRELTKRYGNTLACDALNLSVRQGMTFGLLGPNGAGKSTLIRMLMGLTPADSGEVMLFGENANERTPEIRRRIGYVPELHFIYRWMTIQEVLDFVSQLYANWDSDLANAMLSKFELSTKKRVAALSKGMTAKLGLIIALAHNPDLLILDEPTSGLDPIIREDFLESVLQSHACKGRTILFSSHHVDDVERVADEVGILVNGRFAVRGSVEELRSRIKRIRVVLPDGKLPARVPPEALFQKLSRREWTVTVDPFSEDLLRELQLENDAVSADVFDMNLEEIFKDVVRGETMHREETDLALGTD